MLVSSRILKFSVLLALTCGFMSLVSFFMVARGETIILDVELFSWSGVSFSFMVVLDKISCSFSVVVTLIASSVFMFAHKYMEEDPFKSRFIWVLMAFVLSMNLLIFSGSVFFLFLGWDGLGITSFALIVYYQSFDSLSSGFQTLMVNRIGDAIIVVSMFLFTFLGQFNFVYMLSGDVGTLVGMMFLLAGLTKSAQFPFSSWLPAAMAAPTPVSALVHSSTLVTAGIFLIIRLCYNIPLGSEGMGVLIFVGSITCLLGGWAATMENDIKKIIALSTLSQLGVMVFSLGLGYPNLALFHLYTHALFKALLFLTAGHILMASFGTQDIRLLGGLGMSMPTTVVLFNVSSLCLVGAPFLSSFYSKHVILEKMFMGYVNLFGVLFMLLATGFTAKYVSRTLKSISWGKTVNPVVGSLSGIYTTIPIMVLGTGAIVGGGFFFIFDVSNLECLFISSFLHNLINTVTAIGVTLGLVMMTPSSFFVSSLFFLTPLLSLSGKLMSPLSKKLHMLDYGWLEPSFLLKDRLLVASSIVTSWFVWPARLGMFRVVFFLVSVFFLYFCII
uniref:NADH-ubiquinone oxidoreductase chain 5 n=1 Tax=Siphonaria gigas TaxID=1087063 RepID=G8HSF1_9GAST|nr:NADH dehydrogenase subunit 5 [Siphonaria gigas]AEQ93914.1 NADH dehydrogenase subunit 5 [Siphonaria gigas]